MLSFSFPENLTSAISFFPKIKKQSIALLPKVVREDIDNLNAVVTVTIGKEDYEPKFKKELNDIRKKASIKGFRKGKTPMSFLKKMYGKGLLSDIVTEMLQNELSELMANKEVTFLGRPIPASDQKPVNFDLGELEDYTFKFDLGKAPDFEVKGIDEKSGYDYFKVKVGDDKVDESVTMIQKRFGERKGSGRHRPS